ncbi:MAG TPA: hypothetical protein VF326_12230 [Anaerolineaceae bacterium]
MGRDGHKIQVNRIAQGEHFYPAMGRQLGAIRREQCANRVRFLRQAVDRIDHPGHIARPRYGDQRNLLAITPATAIQQRRRLVQTREKVNRVDHIHGVYLLI